MQCLAHGVERGHRHTLDAVDEGHQELCPGFEEVDAVEKRHYLAPRSPNTIADTEEVAERGEAFP